MGTINSSFILNSDICLLAFNSINTEEKVKLMKKWRVCEPESQFSGLSGSGWAIKAIIALQTD